MALNNDNNNECCKCTTPEYELILNEQGPQGRQGEKGDAGFTPIISVKDNTPSNYTLNILTQDGQITTPNLKANLPAGGATGQVLTKNSGEQDDCSWQNLPASTIETEGIARLATEADFETTEDTEASDNTIVTPALFNSELKKQSANFVTTDTAQTITGQKVFKNSFVTSDGTATKGNRVLINNSRIDLINNSGVAAIIDPEGISLRGGINSYGLSLQSSDRIVTFGQNNTPMRIYAIALERYSNANDTGAIILDAKNYKNYTYPKTETDNLLNTKVNTSDMVEVPVVVEQSDKSLMPSWYRVWSNGWIEQGGQISVTNTTTVNLLKPYTQTNYLPNTQAIGQSIGNQANTFVNPINVNSFSITSSASTAQDFNWYCVGY